MSHARVQPVLDTDQNDKLSNRMFKFGFTSRFIFGSLIFPNAAHAVIAEVRYVQTCSVIKVVLASPDKIVGLGPLAVDGTAVVFAVPKQGRFLDDRLGIGTEMSPGRACARSASSEPP